MAAPGLFLAVLGLTSQTLHRLPLAGRVTIGRAEDCDVVIDDASVSRRHAQIDLGPPVTLSDLGSSNGTRLRRRGDAAETTELFELRLEDGQRAPIAVGEAISVGSVIAFLRQGDVGAARDGTALAATPGDGLTLSLATKRVRDLAVRIAKGPVSVLICGETGVGKEVLARLVHASSPRAAGPFVAVNCGAMPDSLAESELFGHEKGAFTGATSTRAGLFESADGGTLFLDEVAELSPALQTKLLRVVEDKKVQRLGADSARTVDIRIVSATHGDLDALSKSGRFRQDLYFRLNGILLTVPPLRDRKEEIAALARSFAAQAAWALGGQSSPELSPAVLARLEEHAWPGNVRELRNVIERAVVLADGAPIEPEHLLLDLSPRSGASPIATLQGDLDALEKKRILDALTACEGNQTKAALLLGMPRRTLVTRLSQYGIERPRKR